MFALIDRPVFFPGRTLFGDTQGPVVDTSIELPVGGHVYLSIVEAIHVGKAVDMVEGNVHDQTVARVAELEQLVAERDARILELEVGRPQVVSLDEVQAMLAAGVTTETPRKKAKAA